MPRQDKQIVQIPLAVDLEVETASASSIISGITNGFIEKNEGNGTTSVVKRRGYNVIDTSVPNYQYNSALGFLYIQALDEIALIYYNTSTSSDNLYYNGSTYDLSTSYPSVYEMTYIESGGNYYIFIVGSSSSTSGTDYGWVFRPSTTTLTRLTNATHGFPNGDEFAQGAISLDTYAFVLAQNGKLYNSNVGDILNWTSTDFLQVENAEDQKVYLAKHHDHIVIAGTQTITFYYDAGNPTGSPLAVRKDLTIPLGVYSSIIPGAGGFPTNPRIDHDDEYIAFVGTTGASDLTVSTASGALGVYIIDNFRVKKISNRAVEDIINSSDYSGRIFLHNMGSRKVIILKCLTALDLVYDITTGYWHRISRGSTESVMNIAFVSGEYIVGEEYGEVARYSHNFPYDVYYNGSTTSNEDFPFTIQTPQVSFGTSNNKFCKSTTLLGEYTSTQCDMEISWTDDGYNNFSTARDYDLRYFRKLSRCGKFRRRSWKIHQDSGSTGVRQDVRLSHIEVEVSGASVNTGD